MAGATGGSPGPGTDAGVPVAARGYGRVVPDDGEQIDALWLRHGSTEAPLVVLLHGFGGTEQDMAATAAVVPAGWSAAAPRAPHRHGPGRSWFCAPGSALDARVQDVAPAADTLAGWIGDHRRAGQPVVAVGFSQGGAVAVQTLRRHPGLLAGAVTMSGFIPRGPESGDAALRRLRPPVLWADGGLDDVIPARDIALMDAYLPAHTTLTRYHDPGLGHGMSDAELAEVGRFLRACG